MLLLVASFVILAASAHASDLAVTYTVQDKPLKKLAVAGTPLTFTLYTDTACTQLLFQMTVPIENVTLISRLKLLTPKGAVKAPATDELRTTLTGLTTSGNVYLSVTGTGVTPSGPACQAQASSVQPSPAPTLFVRDANATVLGQADSGPTCNGSSGCFIAFHPGSTSPSLCRVSDGPLFTCSTGNFTRYYTAPGCSGTAYITAPPAPTSFAGTVAFELAASFDQVDLVLSTAATPGTSIAVASRKMNGTCAATTGTLSLSPVTHTYDFSGALPPFSVGP